MSDGDSGLALLNRFLRRAWPAFWALGSGLLTTSSSYRATFDAG